MDIREYLESKRRIVDDALKKYFINRNLFFEVMHYSLERGKRIRPILAIASYEANGGKDIKEILPIACGLELIHTYSLIHDDLPAMDNDDYRRGRESAHKKFGEAIAILSGDGLFAYAFELLTEGDNLIEEKYRVVREVAKTVGPNGIVYGQFLDIQEYSRPNPKILRQIHYNKTAQFIALSIKVGAIIARADEKIIDTLTRAGIYLGILFQYTDDILDIVGKKEELGKTPQKDLKNKKITAPLVYGMDSARFRAQRYAQLARGIFTQLGARFEVFNQLTDFILNRTY